MRSFLLRSVLMISILAATQPCSVALCDQTAAGQPPVEHSESKATQLRLVAESYLSHREGFTQFTMRFVHKCGSVSEPTSLGVNAPLNDEIVTSGKWIVRNGLERFEKVIDSLIAEHIEADILRQARTNPGSGPVAAPTRGLKFLTDRTSVQVNYAQLSGAATVQTTQDELRRPNLTPFDLGLMGSGGERNPGYLIHEALDAGGQDRCQIGEDGLSDDGIDVTSVTLKDVTSWMFRWKFAKNRDYLPIEIEAWDPLGVLQRRALVTRLEQLPDGRWLPARSVVMDTPESRTGPFRLDVFEITHFDAATVPVDAEFAIDLPAGTIVNDGIHPDSQLTLAEDSHVDLARARELLSQTDSMRARDIGSITPKVVPAKTRALLVANILLLAIIAVALFWSRRRRVRR